MKVMTISGLQGVARSRSLDLSKSGHALISKTGLLEFPTEAIHGLHDAVLARGTRSSPVMRPHRTVQGCCSWRPSMERDGQLLRTRAVAIRCGQDIIPHGLEIVPIGVRQGPRQAVHRGRRGRLFYRGLQVE